MQLSKVLDEIRERVGIENLTDSCSGRGCRVDMTDVPRDRIVVDMELKPTTIVEQQKRSLLNINLLLLILTKPFASSQNF